MPKRPQPRFLLGALAAIVLVAACGGVAAPIVGIDDKAAERSGDGLSGAPYAADPQAGVPDGRNGADIVGSLTDAAKIVRTGTLELEVTAFGEALTKGRTAIVGLGGYVAASEERHDGDRDFASVTYRIPVDRWDDAVSALRGLASTVLTERTSAVEVTAQLVDLDARIANLQASERQLVAIMAKATRIPDILEVQAQLTTVRGEIEQLTAQRAHLADQAAYGTLAVTWSTPAAPVAETQQAWEPVAEIEKALAALLSVGQVVVTAGIWLAIVGLPLLLVGGMVAAVALWIARRVGRPGAAPASPAAPA
jgi:hypothetical protein